MRALVIHPDPTELLGLVGQALVAQGFELDSFVVVPMERFETPDVSTEFPALAGYDLVVVLGAPWGAWDDARIGSWLGDLLDLLRTAHSVELPILGICFGGQALARALGGTVAPGPTPEIGWYEIATDRPELVSAGPWFQWHYDRLTPPPGSTELARTDLASQAFVIGRSLGLQFHPELDVAELQGWLAMGGHGEALEAGFDPGELSAATEAQMAAATTQTETLIAAFLQDVAGLR